MCILTSNPSVRGESPAIVHDLPSRAVLAGEFGPSMMRAAVSENRRTASCFVCVGYGWEEQRAGCPGVTEPTRSHGPHSGCSLASLLLESGCTSGPFSNCGSGCGSGLFSPCGFFGRVSSRVFTRKNALLRAGSCFRGPCDRGALQRHRQPGASGSTGPGSLVPSAGLGLIIVDGAASTQETPSDLNPVRTGLPKSQGRTAAGGQRA